MTEPPTCDWDAEEEFKALGRYAFLPLPPNCASSIVHAFRSYAAEGRAEVRRWRRHFDALNESHRQALAHIPLKCHRATAALETNQFFFNTMLTAVKTSMQGSCLGEASSAGDRYHGATDRPMPTDVEKVKYVLKNLVRDWSQEGADERQATYDPILTELKSLFYRWYTLVGVLG